MSALTDSAAWKKLSAHKETIEKLHMRQLFADNAERFDDFSLQAGPIFLDYSKNLMTDETMSLLFDLARQEKVETFRDAMLAGEGTKPNIFYIGLPDQPQDKQILSLNFLEWQR